MPSAIGSMASLVGLYVYDNYLNGIWYTAYNNLEVNNAVYIK